MVIIVKITELQVNGKFRYLWLKYVKGVDLSVHCAKCLLGTYSKKIVNRVSSVEQPIVLDEAQSEVFYLCGVALPYKWENNFHLAFKKQDGAVLHVERNGIKITIENTVEITIVTDYIDRNDPNSNKKAYATCRNWQFAYMMRKNGI